MEDWQQRGLSDFSGVWQISRQIEDALGPPGRFEGQAEFAPDAEGLVLTETGLLTLGQSPPLATQRRTLWRALPPGQIAVHFSDGRLFHILDPCVELQEVSHHCPPDIYLGSWDLSNWPIWNVRWSVGGPRKNYVMQSRYRPISPV